MHGLGSGVSAPGPAAGSGIAAGQAHKRLEHKPSAAFVGAQPMSRPPSTLAMGFGLVCCPLTPEVYEEAWFKAQRQGHTQVGSGNLGLAIYSREMEFFFWALFSPY